MIQAQTAKPSESARAANVRLKSIALPIEHGGWGFLLEPILLGMLIAPSAAGLGLGLAAAGIFLVNHPLQLAVKDWRKGKRYPRTPWAERFSAGYGLMAALGLGLALLTAPNPFWLPLLIAIPFALVHTLYGIQNDARTFLAEVCGAVALGATGAAIALAGGWPPVVAFGLWAALSTRAAVSILYVRARLRLERGEPIDPTPSLVAHSAAVLIWVGVSAAGYAPWAIPVALGILLVRAAVGLSALRRPRRAAIIGFQEISYGLLTVVLVALGYRG